MSDLKSTVCKDTSYNNIGAPASARKLATAKTPSTAGTTATEEMQNGRDESNSRKEIHVMFFYYSHEI
jgi:hypothetical protein